MTRVIFMGTPSFSVPSLQVLIDGPFELVAVVTQPDRPSGRGRKLLPSPVKDVALAHGLLLLQPTTLRRPEVVAELASLQPDVIAVAAFGQILRPEVLSLPPFGCINVHASLLPRWRGAAPVQAAILAGDQVTGSTIMLMDEGMDTGPILAQAALAIRALDTGGTLTERLAHHGAGLLSETLPRWLRGDISPQPQDDHLATTCRPLNKEQGQIDWSQPAEMLGAQVRAFNPWPAATTKWEGKTLRILQAVPRPTRRDEPVGTVVQPGPREVAVVTGQGILELLELQLAGRRAMTVDDFVRGRRDFVGSRLG